MMSRHQENKREYCLDETTFKKILTYLDNKDLDSKYAQPRELSQSLQDCHTFMLRHKDNPLSCDLTTYNDVIYNGIFVLLFLQLKSNLTLDKPDPGKIDEIIDLIFRLNKPRENIETKIGKLLGSPNSNGKLVYYQTSILSFINNGQTKLNIDTVNNIKKICNRSLPYAYSSVVTPLRLEKQRKNQRHCCDCTIS